LSVHVKFLKKKKWLHFEKCSFATFFRDGILSKNDIQFKLKSVIKQNILTAKNVKDISVA